MLNLFKKVFGTSQERRVKRYFRLVKEINEWDERLQGLTAEQLRSKTDEFKSRFAKGETLDQLLPEAYAVCKGICRHLCGTTIDLMGYPRQWDMVPHDVQLVGAIAMHQGSIAEMQTGEGKTLTATMPLYLNALTGKPVHLVTVNDYLAMRDCAWMGSIFRALGLTTGVLTGETPPHMRRSIYQSDIVYGTASEFGFDYLRDNSMAMSQEEQVQRGYYFSLIDEIDSILIDEARTPLIISGPSSVSRQMYEELRDPVATLVKLQRDFCNQLASEAKRLMGGSEEDQKNGIRKLWLIEKGMPFHPQLRRYCEDQEIKEKIDQLDLFFHGDQNKQARIDELAQLYIIVDQKANEFEVTDRGIHAWASQAGGVAEDFIMLDLVDEYNKIDQEYGADEQKAMERKALVSENDALRKERAHNMRQMLRAHLLMERDVDYIIQDGKIVIIDENTGRSQPGRRFSDGLHQAIEAKENVEIQKETQTYATITLQNYFRMYEKLAGMTGTAITEANEFKEIYSLEVLSIPTHRPSKRLDHEDLVFMTEREKYAAMLKDIQKLHEQGRPVLIGTESVDISEKLARILRQYRLDHVVLNAKQNQNEAEIISVAGEKGAITVATNMAGRGTDIKLGVGVAELGGLAVIGSTRHPSRRIDRQLRGRCARLGDPGSTQFYLSFEDQLMRFFTSPRLTAMLKRFRPPEGEPISAGILTRSIETAQKRIEQRNYTMRKHTLEYDNVMNQQRQEIYAFRNELLRTEGIQSVVEDLLTIFLEKAVVRFFQSRSEENGWDAQGFVKTLTEHFPVSFSLDEFDDDHETIEDIFNRAYRKLLHAFEQKLQMQHQALQGVLQNPQAAADHALRHVILVNLDTIWQEHLLSMDHLRQEVSLRAVAQKDPLVEFKREAFVLFDAVGEKLRSRLLRLLFNVQLSASPQSPSSAAGFNPPNATQMRLERRSLVDEMESQGPQEGA